MTIDVEELSSHSDVDLIRFLEELGRVTPSVLGYHYPFFRDMLVEGGVGQPAYLGARMNGKLVGLLPAFTRESPVGVVYCSLPYFGPNAGVLCGDGEASADIHTALIQSLLSRAAQDEALSCSIYTPFLFDEFELYDALMPEAVVVEKFTQYLDLKTAVWNRKTIQNIHKAQQVGVKVSRDITPERIETFYGIYEQNCKDIGILLKPKKCVEFLADEAVRSKRVNFYFAFHRGEMISGISAIWSPLTASWHLTCTLAGARTLQASALLLDQAIQDARTHGIRFWNWEGSPSRESGVYRFKKKWGSVEGVYRIYVQTYHSRQKLQELGENGISRHFPLYFVYPFDLL